jgi:hypothetical protein
MKKMFYMFLKENWKISYISIDIERDGKDF